MTYIALLFGIFALLIIKTILWLKKNRFPLFVGDKTFKEIFRDFPEENIDKEITFAKRAKSRIIIAELIPFVSLRSINELREENKERRRRFLTATELACLGIRYKDNKKLSNCFVFTAYSTPDDSVIGMHNKIVLIDQTHSLSLSVDNIQNIHYNMNIPSGYKYYVGVVIMRRGLWMRFLTFICRIIFFAEKILNKKILV